MAEIRSEQATAMCKHCIDYLKTQGSSLWVGDEVDEYEAEESGTRCGWCEEEDGTMYWVMW